MVKNTPVDAGDAGDVDLIPGSGISPQIGIRTYSSILAWKISWTEKPGGLPSMGSQRLGHNFLTKHTHTHLVFWGKWHFQELLMFPQAPGREHQSGKNLP